MRLERKNRTDISYKSSGGLFDLFDNAFTENLDTFSKKRTALIIYIKLMTAYNKSK